MNKIIKQKKVNIFRYNLLFQHNTLRLNSVFSIFNVALAKAFIFILLLSGLQAGSQSFPKTIKLDVQNGLIQNTIWGIEEDASHRIWIGTPGGLQIYDGFELITIPKIEGTILRLQKHDSSIYCITISNLYKFNPTDLSFSKTTFPRTYFYLSEFSEKGIILSADKDSLLFFYDYNLRKTARHSQIKKNASRLFEFTLSGIPFFGGVNGLYVNDSIPISKSYCKQYVKYNLHRAFIASHKGLLELLVTNGKLQVKRHFKDLRITHLLVDVNKNLWVATADNGIFMIHRNSLNSEFFPKTKPDGNPLSCWRFSKIGGQLYVNTAYGLVSVNEKNWQNEKVHQITKNLACNTAVEGDDFILIGSRSNGIYRLKSNKLEQVFVNNSEQLDNIIVQIEKNKKGFLASSKYSFIQLDKKGNFISRRLSDFDDVFGYTMEFLQFPNGIMNSRTTGVVELDSNLKVVGNFKGDSIQVVSMMRKYQNEWWGVSMDAGLIKLEHKQLVKQIFPDKHLFTLNNWNDSTLWISGIHGVYKYADNYIRPFKPQNGFPLKEYNQNAVYKDSLGFLYYAGVGGIQKFHPDSLTFFPNPPTVVIEQNGTRLHPHELSHLNFDQSQIIIVVHPVSISDQNYFKIEITIDTQWVEIKQPEQLKFSLNYGTSKLKVKVTDLVHKTSSTTIYTFSRSFPFWQKPWFIIFVFVLVILLIVGLVSFIGFTRTRKQHKIDQIRIEEQQKGLTAVIQAQENERKRIAKDLHDGIVQQLGGLKLGLQKAFMDSETEESNKLVKVLDDSTKELRDLSHKMMPRALSELGLIPALEDMLENSLGHSDIKYQFEHFGINSRFNENIEIALYRIAQELINNVIKHSNANKVNIQLFKTSSDILLIVEDNGKGIDVLQHKKGIGLMNISSRLDTINGRVNFEPSPESGTLVTIKIPIQQ